MNKLIGCLASRPRRGAARWGEVKLNTPRVDDMATERRVWVSGEAAALVR